jgi:hypothetical protein
MWDMLQVWHSVSPNWEGGAFSVQDCIIGTVRMFAVVMHDAIVGIGFGSAGQ